MSSSIGESEKFIPERNTVGGTWAFKTSNGQYLNSTKKE